MKTQNNCFLQKYFSMVAILCLVLLSASCDSQRQALLGHTKPKTLSEKVTGAYAVVHPVDKDAKVIRGELIAANDQFITLLGDTGLRDVPFAYCDGIKLYISKDVNSRGGLTAWAVILPFTTIIHGLLATLTFPINVAVVVPVIFSIHGYYVTSYPDHLKKETVAKFARFPQGLPAGISYNSLK